MRQLAIAILMVFVLAVKADAAVIFVSDFSNDSTVTHLNHLKDTIIDEVNGSLEGSASGSIVNISANSLGELDMGDNVNPRIRANEITGIGVDTTSTQTAFVYTGLTPADTANLTSDISAGTAYINGYRIAKTSTSNTYTSTMDTYVDLDQNGSFTFSEASVGGAAPAVAANSARLALVTTDGSEITSVTDLANRRVPGLVTPTHYRTGGEVSRDSATIVRIRPFVLEMNGSIVSSTSDTTLTLSTAGDWDGGSSQQATSEYGYVGVDSSAGVKLLPQEDSPSHSNYALTTTAGMKRYVSGTASSTTYRILGWFYMNASGSGQIDTYGYGNLREFGLPNSVHTSDGTSDSVNDTSYGNDLTGTQVRLYSTGMGQTMISFDVSTVAPDGNASAIIDIDETDITLSERILDNSAQGDVAMHLQHMTVLSEGTHTIKAQAKVDSGTVSFDTKQMSVMEL